MGVGCTLDFKRWELFVLYIPMATVKLRFETAISTRHAAAIRFERIVPTLEREKPAWGLRLNGPRERICFAAPCFLLVFLEK
jgi:hypothetical protein